MEALSIESLLSSSGISLAVCYHHVTWTFQSESSLYSCLNVKELLARNRCDIWSLSDSNGIRTYNHLARKRTLNHLAKLATLAKWFSVHLRTKWLWVQISSLPKILLFKQQNMKTILWILRMSAIFNSFSSKIIYWYEHSNQRKSNF